jgi:DNA polymerase-3 subunit alpha
MSQHFTHLHLHTEYSLLDGAISIEKLVKFGVENKLKALAMSDHGNIFGAVKFFQEAEKAGIKPILGMEAYFTEDASIKNAQNKYYHLVILVENETGYKNLCKLIEFSYTTGFYFKPRIDYAILQKYSEGLIVTSACLGGHIPTLLMQNQEEEALKRINWFLEVFGPDRFYLEVQPDDQQEQKILNQKIFEMSAKTGVKLVAAGDCHYTTKEDREAHEVMLAIQTHHKMSDPARFTFGDCRVHIRTTEEMLELFKDHPEAVWNSGVIADRCSFKFATDKLFFPEFPLPADTTQEDYFNKLCQDGLQQLFDTGRIPAEEAALYKDRLELEAQLITKMGFIGYFLVVSDFIQWAKRNDIPVGPGRGSAAGSLVAWALQITDIDPIKYNLLFERFLNPERVTMPDIDIDFCIEGRDRVIQYVRERYGHDHVCQIITFGTMMAKGAIKDVARALGFPFEDSNALTELIPEQLKITLKEAREQEPKIQQLIDSNPQVAKLFDLALRLEGLTRHASKHAAGLVITPEPVSDMLPVYVPPKTTDLVTQYAMTELESLGFLKMDFLGLKNLTLIDRVVKLIKESHGLELDITMLPLDDQKTFELICRGDTSGVFQLESSGLKDVLRRLQPDKFEDIIAVNALYRPGPLGSGMVDDYIERRHKRQKISYIFPELEAVLQETYGVIVYQEQVMKIASTVGGFSLGESDILRRAMGKKKADVMAEQKAIFVQRALSRNFNGKKAEELFDLMAYFAGYGFNKSHSAAYALIAYQTAYLKANYPAIFMACLISLEMTDTEKMSFYLDEAKDMGIPLLPPHINKSAIQFSVIEESILFGLQGIKNVGGAALEEILRRRAQAPFSDILDFCFRVDLRTVNKRVIESLICAGAFDTLPGNRAQKHDQLALIMDIAAERKKAAETGQLGLFSQPIKNSSEGPSEPYSFAPQDEWTQAIKLEKEKEVMGLYISGQPLDSYKPYLKALSIKPFNQTSTTEPVTSCGVVKSIRTVVTKKGDPMAFMLLEDYVSKAEIVIFPKVYSRIQQWLKEHSMYVVKGVHDLPANNLYKIKANDLIPLDLIVSQGHSISAITLILPATLSPSLLEKLKEQLIAGTIPLTLIYTENNQRLSLKTKIKIIFTPQLMQFAKEQAIELQLAL